MIIRSLTKQEVKAEPFRVWNAFVNLLATEDYEYLAAEQRPAHLIFWYKHEVQNGGHLQFFENRGTRHLTETIQALGLLEATNQQQILREAGELWFSHSRPCIQIVQDYCDIALQGEFDALDSRFYKSTSALVQYLEAYLERHQSSFVSVT